ncbi:hypothetical protein [Tahibacter amnicola]|uniref:Uncharacterized protein n=1 Tax=Tahibacter amnicola TaxID=2976241 RepID=A0ABY6BM20_9GAMM|nr:hypothetical protein [Tahibacter amnicola]UXI70498.1 hypothetical protein N4264_12930 [Tahibacter amnicola]
MTRRHEDRFIAAPRRHLPLWRVFWLDGVLASHIFFGVVLFLYPRLDALQLGALLGAFIAYTAWILRRVWINAFNVRNETYAHMARALTVAWSLNAVLVSFFLYLGYFGMVDVPL